MGNGTSSGSKLQEHWLERGSGGVVSNENKDECVVGLVAGREDIHREEKADIVW